MTKLVGKILILCLVPYRAQVYSTPLSHRLPDLSGVHWRSPTVSSRGVRSAQRGRVELFLYIMRLSIAEDAPH